MKMVLVQCSQVSHSYNLQQHLLGNGAALCHLFCAHKPSQHCGSGCCLGTGMSSWRQEGQAGVEVGTGTKPCGCWGEAGSWPGLVVPLRPSVLGTREGSGQEIAGRGLMALMVSPLMAAGGAAGPVPLPVCQGAGWALVPLFPSSQPCLCQAVTQDQWAPWQGDKQLSPPSWLQGHGDVGSSSGGRAVSGWGRMLCLALLCTGKVYLYSLPRICRVKRKRRSENVLISPKQLHPSSPSSAV